MTVQHVERRVAAANRTHIARDLGVSRPHVSNVLRGKEVPSIDMAYRIARKLGVSLDDFHSYWQQANAAVN